MASPSLLSKLSCQATAALYGAGLGAFPKVVRVETTNACNAKCIICPHSEMSRPVKNMDQSLFERVVDECAENHCQELHLHNFGEPFIDKKLISRIQYAVGKGIKKVKIFSNGSLIKREVAEQLIDSGLSEIKVSFDGANKKEFEEIRHPLKYQEVIDNIHGLVEARNAKKSSMKIKVSCVSTSDSDSTMEQLGNIVDSFSFGKIHNWADQGDGENENKLRKPCSRVWRTFTILSNGDVALCCLDYDGKNLLGHVDEKTSIADIWKSEKYLNVRSIHKKGLFDQIPLCSQCSKTFV
ncbi:MAG: SPASM domain-containing protein [Planctomycetes bacterium]|nr:SPASM domain-containing protein [Planctomycetota bacterium]